MPDKCSGCSRELDANWASSDPVRHQVWDIPPVKAEVTEHQRFRTCCPDCGKLTLADLPPGTPNTPFGVGLCSMVGLLVGQFRLSRRQCESLLRDAFGVAVSLGGIKSMETMVSDSVAESVAAVHQAVQQSSAMNADDTGWSESNKKAVLWNANTPDWPSS